MLTSHFWFFNLPLFLALPSLSALGDFPRSQLPVILCIFKQPRVGHCSRISVSPACLLCLPALPACLPACLIDFQIQSLFWTEARSIKGSQKHVTGFHDNECSAGLFYFFFLFCFFFHFPSCKQEHKGNKSPPGDRMNVVQSGCFFSSVSL